MESWKLAVSSQPIPVSVLTGFLGSGKTTVLNHLIQQPALSRTLVLINEFGLDQDLVAHNKEHVVIEMANGWPPYPKCRDGNDVATVEVRP